MKIADSPATLARRERFFPATVQQELRMVEARLGGRQTLVGLLTLAPLTRDLRYFLGLLGDPQHQSTPLADLCALGNILPGDLLQHLGAAALLRGKVEAAQKIGDGIAAVAEDVVRRAAPYEEACTDCRGVGTITPDPTPQLPNPSPGPCPTCNSTGKLRYLPDLERQKLAVEMAHLLPKSGGINIALQQTALGGGAGGSGISRTLEGVQALTDRLLYGDGGTHLPEEETAAGTPTEVVEGTVDEAASTEAPDA